MKSADAFRPGYTGHDPKIYLARDLRRELMPHIDRPGEAPGAKEAAALIRRPWCDSCFFSFDIPQTPSSSEELPRNSIPDGESP